MADDRMDLIADLQGLRAHHIFTAERIGQPGCAVRLQATEFVETLDRVLAEFAGPNPSTPAARWRSERRPDPHGDEYGCERAKLCGGHLTDDEVAYQTAMLMRGALNHESVLQTAKDRIRWLSRRLVLAVAPRAALKLAIGHIEHMAAWIGKQPASYSFEALGEDMPSMKSALGDAPCICGNNPCPGHTIDEANKLIADHWPVKSEGA